MDSLTASLQLSSEQYLRRFNNRLRGTGRALEMHTSVREDTSNFYLDFSTHEERASLIIPRTRRNEFGNLVIGDRNDRALCPFMVVLEGRPRHISYEELVHLLIFANVEELFPEQGKRNFMDKVLRGFMSDRGRLAVGMCQRFLNLNLFNALPLSGTPMQDWAMNRRLMIFDPLFRALRPDAQLEYQKRKNRLLYPWSSIGLSDSAAATKNYILQEDLKRFTAFGRHHNPIRNLYSTLGMKGEETAWVVSAPMRELERTKGIKRFGWNWMTAFLDLPENFEDQILVSRRHANKTVTYQRSFMVFGSETVTVGDTITKGRILGVNEDESPVVFDVHCEHAKVVAVEDGAVPFDGKEQPVRIVNLEVTYRLREGVKITNQHGNKGIVVLADLGVIRDPVWGEVPIDVIVSAKSVQKRRNFGQILEAMTTRIKGPGRSTVVPEDLEVSVPAIEKALEKAGQPRTGGGQATTPWGEFDTLFGWVHWGITKTPEEQLWEKKDVLSTNQQGIRTRGNKVSTVELKALTTLLGPKSHVVEEILSYQQGVSEVAELLHTLRGMKGEYLPNVPVVGPEAFVYLPAGLGTFHTEEQLAGTIADEAMYPKGCYVQLPLTLEVQVPNNQWKGGIQEGLASEDPPTDPELRVFRTDKILVPSFDLRQPWCHPTGKFGLSDTATLINQILEAIDRLKHGEIKATQLSTLIYRYFHQTAQILSTKTGKMSTYLMSVRYPWSSKATATLGRNLEANWVEIHKDMAEDLKVQDGDFVLIERFPCLGFMSTRIQRVKVTDDPECKFVIRVSGNSLVSMNLDFDGDVVYVMSFHTKGSKIELADNFLNPHPKVKEVLDRLNERKKPVTKAMLLQDMDVQSFPKLGPEEHAELNAISLAVKVWTGPVIALCYNLQRIVEGNFPYGEREAHINVEVFLDKVGNSVFSQKHGTRSLREECIEAVCLAKPEALVKLGFPVQESTRLCAVIRKYAEKLGIRGDAALHEHYQRHVKEGRSNIINLIVRRFHRAYFATRANLHPIHLLEYLSEKPHDLVGHLIWRSLRKSREEKTSKVKAIAI